MAYTDTMPPIAPPAGPTPAGPPIGAVVPSSSAYNPLPPLAPTRGPGSSPQAQHALIGNQINTHADQAFQTWYSQQRPEDLVQFNQPEPANTLRISSDLGGTQQNPAPRTASELQALQKQSAKDHFLENVLPTDPIHQQLTMRQASIGANEPVAPPLAPGNGLPVASVRTGPNGTTTTYAPPKPAAPGKVTPPPKPLDPSVVALNNAKTGLVNTENGVQAASTQPAAAGTPEAIKEGLGAARVATGQQNADTNKQNADTKAGELKLKGQPKPAAQMTPDDWSKFITSKGFADLTDAEQAQAKAAAFDAMGLSKTPPTGAGGTAAPTTAPATGTPAPSSSSLAAGPPATAPANTPPASKGPAKIPAGMQQQADGTYIHSGYPNARYVWNGNGFSPQAAQ